MVLFRNDPEDGVSSDYVDLCKFMLVLGIFWFNKHVDGAPY